MSFDRALPGLLTREGGYVNSAIDRGGETNFGITWRTYDDFRASKGLPLRSVREITREEVEEIYRTRYWDEAGCEDLPWPVDVATFDAAVNHGPRQARVLLQRALRVTDDGVIGPKTLAALAKASEFDLFEDLLWTRLAFYRSISMGDQLGNLRGWIARLLELRKEVLG